jgi:hypothetical protein
VRNVEAGDDDGGRRVDFEVEEGMILGAVVAFLAAAVERGVAVAGLDACDDARPFFGAPKKDARDV